MFALGSITESRVLNFNLIIGLKFYLQNITLNFVPCDYKEGGILLWLRRSAMVKQSQCYKFAVQTQTLNFYVQELVLMVFQFWKSIKKLSCSRFDFSFQTKRSMLMEQFKIWTCIVFRSPLQNTSFHLYIEMEYPYALWYPTKKTKTKDPNKFTWDLSTFQMSIRKGI